MALTDAERFQAARRACEELFGKVNKTANLDLADVKAAIDYTDTWIDTNQAAWITGLPAAFAGNSTAKEKAMLFAITLALRWELS